MDFVVSKLSRIAIHLRTCLRLFLHCVLFASSKCLDYLPACKLRQIHKIFPPWTIDTFFMKPNLFLYISLNLKLALALKSIDDFMQSLGVVLSLFDFYSKVNDLFVDPIDVRLIIIPSLQCCF